jgi:endonuclease YncB( thermonuclease family)
MKTILFFTLALIGCYANTYSANGTEIHGKVIKIVDGDTYDILLYGNITKRIRMEGIDAPERGMPFYKVSKDYLAGLCFGQNVRIAQTGLDRYGRMLAKTFLSNGNELGMQMIIAGYAWHFKKYSADVGLANAEIVARKNRVGLWADEDPEAPWVHRALHKVKN